MIKKIQTILIDDEHNAVEALSKLLAEYCPQVEVIAKAHSADEAYLLIIKHQPDLIFLDIQMPSGSGFDLLTQFPNPDFKVIFATAFDFYALNAIKFSALDYLLKPIAPIDLKEAVAKATTQIKSKQLTDDLQNLINTLQNPRNRKNKINVSTQSGIELIEVNQIVRCEAVNGFTILHLENRKNLVSSRDLKFYNEVFDEYDFYRVHDSHLVSYHHIKKIANADGGIVLMSDTAKVPISRRRKSEFMDWLKNY
jgi:two-component system, LytTR family, response regulator